MYLVFSPFAAWPLSVLAAKQTSVFLFISIDEKMFRYVTSNNYNVNDTNNIYNDDNDNSNRCKRYIFTMNVRNILSWRESRKLNI